MQFGRMGAQFGMRNDGANIAEQFLFTDDFNRANETLGASANWTRLSTGSGDANVNSNSLTMNDTFAVGSAYLSPDCGQANHYVQFKLLTVANAGGPFVLIRALDQNNYIGIRNSTTSAQIYTCIAGVFAFVGGTGGVLLANDVIRAEAFGTQISMYVNSVLAVGPLTISAGAANTRCGVVARGGIVANWIDNYENGVI